MIDFLKANPTVSREEYMWEWTIPQIRLAMSDNTHVEYLTEEQAKKDNLYRTGKRIESGADLANDLGIPIFN